MKKISALFILITFLISISYSQTKQNIIVDTDCALDDLRAITMMLAIDELNISAITTCDGGSDPFDGIQKVKTLLNYFNKKSIQTGIGRTVLKTPPSWRVHNKEVRWGNASAGLFIEKQSAVELITKTLMESKTKVTICCLGSLTNIADAIKKNPGLTQNLDKIVWYNKSIFPLTGDNYELDKASAEYVMASNLRVHVISNLNDKNANFKGSFFADFENAQNDFQRVVFNAHQPNDEYTIWDDLIPVYLIYPDVFDMYPPSIKIPNIQINKSYDVDAAKFYMLQFLCKTYSVENNISFYHFPVSKENYAFDMRSSVDSIVKAYGTEEWKSCVITNELHGHLGVYSIVGAKMGIRAREILHAPIDRLEVISFAGGRPPMGCLNDGLQASTGSTLGYGTFQIATEKDLRPEANFVFSHNQSKKIIKLKLKPMYSEQVEKDIKNGILMYGNLTSGYWKLVRQLAIKYWKEWDRRVMFDEQILEE